MSVDQIPSRQSPGRPNDTKLVRYEDYIESKIDSTRRMVKAVDLASALVTLVAAVLAYLLTIAVIEHWIVPSGFNMVGRTALFTILVIGVGYFVYHRVWSLLVKAINPVYAARTIEHGSPTLKNTLINLLFFRERRAGISDAVYRTLEEQAAQRLTRVPVETAVDRSLLIRLGYVLIAVVALAGLYKVFSPKDPLISAERILFPWADIVPASRVTISALTPGSVTVSRGESVDVSAEVHGLGDNDAAVLRYTTADGQVVGKAIPMKPAGDGLRYACKVTDTSDEFDSVGLTRNLTYRLEAGDARSLDYSITVISAPSILVERVDYHYPPYTGYVDRSVEGLGDIRAIEGTRMTIHARANGVIRVADVDFDADGRPDLRMTTKEAGADASFELSLREDRQTPRHASYVLRFTNEEGRANRDPVKHSIGVDRDMDPEASVLLPKEKDINARLDETVAIDVEAIDPDFGLAGVRLRGEVAGQTVLDERLLKAAHRGKFLGHYLFVANAHGLHAGDEVKYWVEAEDVRTPKSNVAATEKRTIRIVSPNPGQQPPPDRIARNDRQQPKPDAGQNGRKQDQQNPGDQGQGEKNQGGGSGQKDQANQQKGGESGGQGDKSQQPQQGEKQQGGGQGEKGGEQNNNNDQQQSKGDSKSGGEGKSTNSQGGEQKGNEQKSGENGQNGSQSQSGENSNQKSKDGQQGKGEQTGAGASGGQQSKDAARPAGTRPDQSQNSQQSKDDQQSGGQKKDQQQKGEPQSKSGDQQSPVSSEGDNDGEAFERIQKRLEKSGEIKKDEKSGSESEQKQGEKSEGEKGREGGGEKAQQQQSGQDKQAGDKSQDGKSGNGQSGEKPGEAEQKQQPGQQGKGDGKTGEKPGDADQKQQQSGRQEKGDRKSGDAKSQGDDSAQKKEQQPGYGEKQQSPGGQENTSKGPAGAGEEKQPTGSPKNSEQGAKPTEKHEQSGSKEGTNKQEPPAGANGKKESDSSGDQGGDKTGGGEEGAGQKSPREGTGSDGQHQSADNGAGQSGEKGKGETSQSGGKDAKSDHETGSSDGKTPGKGSQQKDGTGNKQGGKAGGENATSRDGENAGGEKGDKAGSKEGEKNAAQSKAEQEGKEAGKQQQEKDGKGQGKPGGDGGGQQGGEKGQGKDGKGQGKPGGDGGGPGGAVNPQPNITGTAPEGDTANLEYARKRTDLVLDKLADQLNKNKVDDGMLKELGWTRDDLRRFVERWQQRKDAAERDDPKAEGAKRELDEALRSLGLRQDKLQQNAVQKDTMRDLKQGYRGPVPLEYQERLRAYNQGVSRAARDGE